MALTDKQAVFVNEYLIDLIATQAAIRAEYSPATAKEIGYENLTKPYLRACINSGPDWGSDGTGAEDYISIYRQHFNE